VNIQGEAEDRRRIESIWQIQVRNRQGEMVPMRSIAELRFVLGPQVITRYNNYRSITINGAPAPGRSSGDALVAMKEVSDKTCRGLRLRMDRHASRNTRRPARPGRSWRWR
jgi:multidrug efflux pump subunit AcrB